MAESRSDLLRARLRSVRQHAHQVGREVKAATRREFQKEVAQRRAMREKADRLRADHGLPPRSVAPGAAFRWAPPPPVDHRAQHVQAFLGLLDRVPRGERGVVREVWDCRGDAAQLTLESRRLYRLAERLREDGDERGAAAVMEILELLEACLE